MLHGEAASVQCLSQTGVTSPDTATIRRCWRRIARGHFAPRVVKRAGRGVQTA